MLLILPLLLLPSLWPSWSAVACANSTAAKPLLKGTKHRGAVQANQSPMKSLTAAAAGDASENSETSNLVGLEFNTPYSHEIAALAAVLLIVASVGVVLALKFTQRAAAAHEFKSAATEDSTVDIDDADDEELETVEPGDEAGEEAAGRNENVPIMHRFIFSKPSSNYSYESLLQTKRKPAADGASGDSGLDIAVCRFSARLDEANGLLCLHDFQLSLRALEDHEHSNLDSWTLAIDIVAQTDVECRQMRLQTRLRRTTDEEEEAGQGGGGVGWLSEPIDDVLAVRIKQNVATSTPPKGRLLIRALALQSGSVASTASGEPKQKQADSSVSSMLKLGGATFSLDRVRRPSMSNLEVTLREKS